MVCPGVDANSILNTCEVSLIIQRWKKKKKSALRKHTFFFGISSFLFETSLLVCCSHPLHYLGKVMVDGVGNGLFRRNGSLGKHQHSLRKQSKKSMSFNLTLIHSKRCGRSNK